MCNFKTAIVFSFLLIFISLSANASIGVIELSVSDWKLVQTGDVEIISSVNNDYLMRENSWTLRGVSATQYDYGTVTVYFKTPVCIKEVVVNAHRTDTGSSPNLTAMISVFSNQSPTLTLDPKDYSFPGKSYYSLEDKLDITAKAREYREVHINKIQIYFELPVLMEVKRFLLKNAEILSKNAENVTLEDYERLQSALTDYNDLTDETKNELATQKILLDELKNCFGRDERFVRKLER